jgi:hypothetical protein
LRVTDKNNPPSGQPETLSDKPETASGKVGADRGDRLASELRGNLKRRKGQSRMRGEDVAPGKVSRNTRKTLIDPD